MEFVGLMFCVVFVWIVVSSINEVNIERSFLFMGDENDGCDV